MWLAFSTMIEVTCTLSNIFCIVYHESGLDVLASAKRAEGSFKVPREKVSSMMSSIDEEVENSTSALMSLDDVGSGVSTSGQSKSRRYRDSSGSKTFDSGIIICHQLFYDSYCF